MDGWKYWLLIGILSFNLAVGIGTALRPPQVISVQSLVRELGTAEARAQLWQAKAEDLAKQLQTLQQQPKK